MRDVRLQGITVGSRETFADLMRAVALHESRPVMDRTFGFEDLKGVLEYLMAGKHFGKVAIAIS
jgi:NADPH:quinone reductase-like Zn-dependent oxidoreductase